MANTLIKETPMTILDTDICVSFLVGEHIGMLRDMILCVKDMEVVFGNLSDITLCILCTLYNKTIILSTALP